MFNAKGFLVAILEDDQACADARARLMDVGFAPKDLRIYTSKEILDDHERYLKARSAARRVVGALTDDQATIDLYFGYAQEGRGALWVHVPEKHDAPRTIRHLTDHRVLHYRYFGHDPEEDIRVH